MVKNNVIYKNLDAEKKANENWKKEKLIQKARSLVGKSLGQCVQAVQKILGNDTPSEVKGLARNIPTNSQVPEIGAVIKTNESLRGHVGVVIEYTTTQVTFIGCNEAREKELLLQGQGICQIRTMNLDDSRIEGYIIKGGD